MKEKHERIMIKQKYALILNGEKIFESDNIKSVLWERDRLIANNSFESLAGIKKEFDLVIEYDLVADITHCKAEESEETETWECP